MGDHDCRRAGLLQFLSSVLSELAPQRGIDAGEGFVQQHHSGFRREGTNQRDALLLTAGKRMWVSLGECGKADPVEQLFDDLIALRRGKATQTECHVLRHGQMRKQRVILEH